MLSRVVRPQMMYYGEVFINGKWKRVTMPCHTRFDAKLELKNYKKEEILNI